MLRPFSQWLISRRFRKLFVDPFKAEVSAARASHKRNEALKVQREFLHAALKGRSA